MKAMNYNGPGTTEILDAGIIDGYSYAIVNISGTHPCCYVRLSEDSKLRKIFAKNKDYEEFYDYADVHGGFTFGCDHDIPHPGMTAGCWLGWDYAHYGDYIYFHDYPQKDEGKKWTTEELIEDCKNCIKELIEAEKNL